MPRFRQMAAEAGRDPESLPVTIGGAPEDLAQLRHFRYLGAARVNVSLPAEGRTQILPILDRWAGFIRQLRDWLVAVHCCTCLALWSIVGTRAFGLRCCRSSLPNVSGAPVLSSPVSVAMHHFGTLSAKNDRPRHA